MQTDFQALMDIARVNEELVSDEQFNIGIWMNECGTVGCLIGNWLSRRPRESLTIQPRFQNGQRLCRVPAPKMECGSGDAFIDVAVRLGMREVEATFLFVDKFSLRDFFSGAANYFHDRTKQSRAQNIARLRKFIYYKLRKAEIFADYERARHQEGNWNVAQHAREMAGC